jgi:glycosyltransferase involved in cell wall biosynthesis
MSVSLRMSLESPSPFFESGPSPVDEPRRLLLLSYFFAPSTQVGARRWLFLSQFAVKRGWSIDVLMMDPSSERAVDDGLLRELPCGVRLFAIGHRDPVRARVWRAVSQVGLRLRDRLYGSRIRAEGTNLGLKAAPARTVSTDWKSWVWDIWRSANAYAFFLSADDWIDRAAELGRRLHQDRAYDLVLSCGPPHSAHVAAERIARFARIPFVVDMRDAIAFPEVWPVSIRSSYLMTRTSEWERRAISSSELAVANTDALLEALAARYPEAKGRLLTVLNGADPDVRIDPKPTTTFIIAHTGSIYVGRDPRALFQAMAALIQRRALRPTDIRLHFMGDTAFDGVPLDQLAMEAGVGSYLIAEPTQPRAAVHSLLATASVLTILPQAIPYAIPAKVFEYVQAPAWLLVLSEPDASIALLLRGTPVDMVRPDDIEGISRALEARFDAFRRGERPLPLNVDGRFNRSHQAERLMSALDRIVPPRGSQDDKWSGRTLV